MKILVHLKKEFSELADDRFQLEGRSGWNRLRTRISREEKEFVYFTKQ